MALDKTNKNAFYLFGRYVAVVERSNNKFFNAAQMQNIQEDTVQLMRYDRNKLGFADVRQEIVSKLSTDGWPKKVLADADGGRFALGYYQQKFAIWS